MTKQSELLEIIALAKKGNQKAQSVLLSHFWDRVYGYVFQKVGIEEEAEDIAIQTFTKAITKLKLYNKDFDFSTWLISIAHNTIIDYYRKSSNRIQFRDLEEYSYSNLALNHDSPEEKLIEKQNRAFIRKKLDTLPEKYRKVIELRFLEEKTYKEISAQLNLSMPNVKVRLLRAKKLLAESFNH